jgi:catechol 2,3-dioxygenase-like lactoylglutathione lyase family enzyme
VIPTGASGGFRPRPGSELADYVRGSDRTSAQMGTTDIATGTDAQLRSNRVAANLNHMIIPARDKRESARFLAEILGLDVGADWAHFVPLRTNNGVTLDFADSKDFRPLHCAFLVSDGEFDCALSRLKERGVKFYADFDGTGLGAINRLYGGRGVYFDDPNGHLFELITRPYGTEPQRWIDGKAARSNE